MNISLLTDQRIVFLDGSMGTMLQRQALKSGESPELLNLTAPEKVREVHEAYLAAGVDILNTNTFGGNRLKLKEYDLDTKIIEINTRAVQIAQEARQKVDRPIFIAGSIGPTGEFLAPLGKMSFEALFEIYAQQVKALSDAGADIINLETMVDIAELRVAVLAARSVTHLPIFANLTFTESGRTLTGSDPLSGFNILHGLGLEFVGMNCGMGPDDMARIIQGINAHIPAKIVIQANAGIPKLIDGKTVFTCSPHDYVAQLRSIVSEGVNVIGGCCGTTPEFMQKVIAEFKDAAPKKAGFSRQGKVYLSSPTTTVILAKDQPFGKIGEKINPSALKKIADDIRTGSSENIKETARLQIASGAQVLDVNFGLGASDEEASFKRFIPELTAAVKVPLCIDTTHPKALETALRLYPGRALINSISGEAERLAHVLPLMKTYGSYAILLPLDNNGIPESTKERMEIVERVLLEASKIGVPAERFVVDGLIMAASATPHLAKISLETVREAYTQFGLLATCGLSNISFGLPGRNGINATFLSMLIGAGMDCAILNPQDELLNIIIDSANVLSERDPHAGNFIARHKTVKNFFKDQVTLPGAAAGLSENPAKETVKKIPQSLPEKIYQAIVDGNKTTLPALLEEALHFLPAQELLNKHMIPAIMAVGDLYDKKIYFLPQLMQSAEAMKTGTRFLEPALKESKAQSRGTIVIATVKGDIHDIGKNIVAIILENYGFKVIDLGKDIAKEVILEKALEHQADIIALSALMTTTMAEMEHFMRYMNNQGHNIPVMIGGAVVNERYAHEIGAQYSKDAVGATELAGKIMALKKS